MNRNALQLDGRTIGVAVVAFLGFWLLRVGTSSGELSAAVQVAALAGGLILFVGAAIFLFQAYRQGGTTASDPSDVQIGQPAIATFLFTSVRSAPLWLGLRLYLGYEWFEAGRHKLSEAAWMDGSTALQGFWERAVTVPAEGRAPITYDPYRDYLQFMLDQGWYTWFSKVIVFGELLIGLGLILGALTGIAAFSGALLNMSFMLAGTVSTNPVLFILSILIVLAWRVAGLIGLDRWLLPALGVPWRSSRSVPPTSNTSNTPLAPRAT